MQAESWLVMLRADVTRLFSQGCFRATIHHKQYTYVCTFINKYIHIYNQTITRCKRWLGGLEANIFNLQLKSRESEFHRLHAVEKQL